MGHGGHPRTQANETTFEPSRTCRPLPAAWTSSCGLHGSGSRILTSGPRGLTALASAEPAVIIAGLICPAQVSQAPGHTASLAVGHGHAHPAQRGTPIRRFPRAQEIRGGGEAPIRRGCAPIV